MHRSALHQRDQRQQARIAVRRALPGRRQMRNLLVQAAHEGRVGPLALAVQQQRGMRQPGDDAAADHVEPPGRRVAPPAAGDPFAHQLAREGLDLQRPRPVEMAQPAEAVQLALPVRVGRLDGKRRAPVEHGHAAGQAERAGLDLIDQARVLRAQIGWRDQQLLGRRRAMPPAQQRRAAQPGERTARCTPRSHDGLADLRAGGECVIRSGIIHPDRLAWRANRDNAAPENCCGKTGGCSQSVRRRRAA